MLRGGSCCVQDMMAGSSRRGSQNIGGGIAPFFANGRLPPRCDVEFLEFVRAMGVAERWEKFLVRCCGRSTRSEERCLAIGAAPLLEVLRDMLRRCCCLWTRPCCDELEGDLDRGVDRRDLISASSCSICACFDRSSCIRSSSMDISIIRCEDIVRKYRCGEYELVRALLCLGV